jgi:secretion/DNA translocation related TadE-like protein
MTPRRAERGNATLALAVGAVVLLMGLMAGALGISHTMATHQARAGADLAAVSAATSALDQVDDTAVCATARSVAEQNQARLTHCEVARAPDEVAVAIEVEVGLAWDLPGFPDHVAAIAYAGNPLLPV